MPSSVSYVEFVKEQLSGAGTITHRRMFGEYGLYCDGKYFACICDDRLLVEGGGEMFLPDVENREGLVELARVTCAALPEKKPRKRAAKKECPDGQN